MTKNYLLIMLIAIGNMANDAAAQNVGIGTTNPSEKLQVLGNIKADTIKPAAIKLIPNAGAGKVLTSDVTGNASWQTTNTGIPGNVGFGGWGDCSVQNISGFNPVVANDGAAGDYFGRSVAISGDFAIIGASLDDIGLNVNQGAAYIFYFNGTNWVQQQKLTAADGFANDQFGTAVSLSGNYAVVGAPFDDFGANTDQGSAYIFFYNGSTWAQVLKIDHASGASGDQFGYSVCLRGNKVIIGSPYDDVVNINQGSADVYAYNGTFWLFQDRLLANDGLANDNFGFSVAIENNYAFSGAPYDDSGGNTDQGSAYQFFYNGSNWVMQLKLTNTNSATANDRYGWSISLSSPYCIIGEPFSGLNDNVGAAHLYNFFFGTWLYLQTIIPPRPLTGNGMINAGNNVSISGDYLIITAPSWSESIFNKEGKLFIYKNLSGLWQLYEDFTDPTAGGNEGFNLNAAIDNNRFVFGAPQAPLNVARGKAVFGKID